MNGCVFYLMNNINFNFKNRSQENQRINLKLFFQSLMKGNNEKKY